MHVTTEMLTAAFRKAIELKLLPTAAGFIDDWQMVKAVLEAALAAADEVPESRLDRARAAYDSLRESLEAEHDRALTAERERDAYLRMLTPENSGGLWYAATGRMDPFVVSWTAMELDGPWHDRADAIAAVRKAAGLDPAPAEGGDQP